MRHTFASLLLQDGAPITYVRRQLGHRDAAITLRVYAHCLLDGSRDKFVNLLDDTHLDASQTGKNVGDEGMPLSAYAAMVSRVGIEPTTRRLRVCCSAN